MMVFRIHLVLAVLLVTCFGTWSCSKGDYPGKTETMNIGVPPLEQNALLYVADHEGFFVNNGLHVVIKDYDTGVAAIKGLLNGEVDIAEAAEFPFIGAVFRKEEIRAIACNDKFENDHIVGRKDRGIINISDLRGKRIGITRKTINEFYLGRFLALNGMNIRDVALVDLTPAQCVKAIAGGEVDAIIVWQPYVGQITKAVDGVVVWPAQCSQAAFGLLVCGNGWLTQHGDTVKHFLKSLVEAQEHLVRHPDEAKAIVQKRLNYDDSYMANIWSQHKFALSHDQALVVAMKDEAQWMINNNLTAEKQLPDFVHYLYTEGLRAVKPEAVNILR